MSHKERIENGGICSVELVQEKECLGRRLINRESTILIIQLQHYMSH